MHLCIPGGRELSHLLRDGGSALSGEKALQRFQEWQIRLRARESFRAAPAADPALATAPYPREEMLDERRLAQSGFADHCVDETTTGRGHLEARLELRDVRIAANDRWLLDTGGRDGCLRRQYRTSGSGFRRSPGRRARCDVIQDGDEQVRRGGPVTRIFLKTLRDQVHQVRGQVRSEVVEGRRDLGEVSGQQRWI